jgi:hypothetical protein
VVARLREYVGDRRRSPRRGARFSARLPLSVSPLWCDEDFGGGHEGHSLDGSTRDLSGSGLTLLLPAVRAGDRYLTDASGYLGLRLETPGGPLCLLAAPARFEQLEAEEEGYGYLLGVRIIKMRDGDRARYLAYLNSLAREERRSGERRHWGATSPADAPAWSDVIPTYVAEAFESYLRHQRVR